MFLRLKVFDVINSPNRTTSIDFFRALAVLGVIFFHYGKLLPFGYLGVDMFFVVSGFLVGGILTKQTLQKVSVHYGKFILQRGFKIWPSYYFFLGVGNLLAWQLFVSIDPNQPIPFWDLKRYLFFYQNYTGAPHHWIFDHVWSLCVEEHFYLALPFMFIISQKMIPQKYQIYALFGMTLSVIILGIVFKHFSFYFTNGKDTYAATHNRIDALAWGVLLNLIVQLYGNILKHWRYKWLLGLTAMVLFFLVLLIANQSPPDGLFRKIYLHSFTPFLFFLILLSAYFVDFSKFKFLQFIAYYSYNWYLWHPFFALYISSLLGINILGLLSYIVLSFSAAFISTILIEEPFLEFRQRAIHYFFGK